MALAKDLLIGAFGYPKQPSFPPSAPEPALPQEPPKKVYNTRESVIRDNPIETASSVQMLVWGNSNPGPGAPAPGGPPPSGIAQGMSKDQGWGKTVG